MEQERERDVIVVGAGPSGATAATMLAQKDMMFCCWTAMNFPATRLVVTEFQPALSKSCFA